MLNGGMCTDVNPSPILHGNKSSLTFPVQLAECDPLFRLQTRRFLRATVRLACCRCSSFYQPFLWVPYDWYINKEPYIDDWYIGILIILNWYINWYIDWYMNVYIHILITIDRRMTIPRNLRENDSSDLIMAHTNT